MKRATSVTFLAMLVVSLIITGVTGTAKAKDRWDEMGRREWLELLRKVKPAPMPPAKGPYSPEKERSPGDRRLISYDPKTGETTIMEPRGGGSEPESLPFHPPFIPEGTLSLKPGEDGAGPPIINDVYPPNPSCDVRSFPLQTVVKLVAVHNIKTGVYIGCSGAMIDEFHVLTAGHCVYSHDYNRFADAIFVYPGQGDAVPPYGWVDWPYHEGWPDWPFGEARGVRWAAYDTYVNDKDMGWDLAVVALNRRVGLYTGWMGWESGREADILYFSGYPGDPPYVPYSNLCQYFGWSDFHVYWPDTIAKSAIQYHGHSGGPSWRWYGIGTWIHGILSGGNTAEQYSIDCRLTNNKMADTYAFIAEDNVNIPPVPLPDLQECLDPRCSKYVSSDIVEQGDYLGVAYNVANMGHAPSGSFDIDFYLSADPYIDARDYLARTLTVAEGLEPLGALASTIDLQVHPLLPPGDYYVLWSVRGPNEYSLHDNDIVIDTPVWVIEKPWIAVTSPSYGSVWYVGNAYEIKWDSYEVPQEVSIDISRDGGATWQPIAYRAPNYGSHRWIPFLPASDQCLIRVTSRNDPSVSGTSGMFSIGFEIEPRLIVNSPNGGESWNFFETRNITWYQFLAGDYVHIDLSRDRGATWEKIARFASNTGVYSWKVTVPSSDRCRIKVTAVGNSQLTDQSDADFSIKFSPANINLTVPDRGAVWFTGNSYNISWKSTMVGPSANVKLELSRDGGATWTSIVDSTPNTGIYPWTPTLPASNKCLVKVSLVTNPFLFDISSGNFTILNREAYCFVDSPNGGETWYTGETRDIVWLSNIGKTVSIEISPDGGATWERIATNVPNNGVFSWKITGHVSNNCLIRVFPVGYLMFGDVSDGPFSIKAGLANILVTSPVPGEDFYIGKTHNITWNSLGAGDRVKIELSRDEGATWESISNSASNSGFYAWTVTRPAAGRCLVKITSLSNPYLMDTSGSFSIVILMSSITVTSSNKKETWYTEETRNINWKSSFVSSDANVKIELSRNGGSTWTTIVESTPNTGTFPWEVTPPTSKACRIRITAGPYVTDTSDADFSIAYPPLAITLLSPRGGEVIPSGSTYDVMWTASNLNSIKYDLMYSMDKGKTWKRINESPITGVTYRWEVPVPPGNLINNSLMKVIAYDATGAKIGSEPRMGVDQTDSPFTIEVVKLTHPDGLTTFYSGDPVTITWVTNETRGEVARVELYLTMNKGRRWTRIGTIKDGNPGSRDWEVPKVSKAMPDCMIRVDLLDKSGKIVGRDMSDNFFTIEPVPQRGAVADIRDIMVEEQEGKE